MEVARLEEPVACWLVHRVCSRVQGRGDRALSVEADKN